MESTKGFTQRSVPLSHVAENLTGCPKSESYKYILRTINNLVQCDRKISVAIWLSL